MVEMLLARDVDVRQNGNEAVVKLLLAQENIVNGATPVEQPSYNTTIYTLF